MTLPTKINKTKSPVKATPRYSPKVERALKKILTGMIVLSALRPGRRAK